MNGENVRDPRKTSPRTSLECKRFVVVVVVVIVVIHFNCHTPFEKVLTSLFHAAKIICLVLRHFIRACSLNN